MSPNPLQCELKRDLKDWTSRVEGNWMGLKLGVNQERQNFTDVSQSQMEV